MAGWGEPRTSRPGDLLAAAVERFLESPTTGAQERLVEALAQYRARTRGIEPPPGAYC